MPKPAGPPARFEGFDRRAPQFFHELAVEMNREWFEAHKQREHTARTAPLVKWLYRRVGP